MAAASVSPLPEPLHGMSARRIPLASNPNAANSPYRPSTAAAAPSKRPRSHALDPRDADDAQHPPAKKQLLDQHINGFRRAKPIPVQDVEGRVFAGSLQHPEKNEFQRRLAAVRSQPLDDRRQPEPKPDRSNLEAETLKQWRKHYRRVFPGFVFYFESIPQEVCIRCSRQVAALHAREEKFFSKAITHIVTSRPIPATPSADISPVDLSNPKLGHKDATHGQVRTINPTLLDKTADFSNAFSKRNKTSPHKKPQPNHNDILHKAAEMGIKIWALEKFERIMTTMFDTDLHQDGLSVRPVSKASLVPQKRPGDADLLELLRNEKLNANVEKTAVSELVPLRGYFVYIHDMDEKTRPVMVREYAKPSKPEDGEWPQFRSVSNGRCPFVEQEPSERLVEIRHREKKKAQRAALAPPAEAPRTRAAAAASVQAADEMKGVEKKPQPLQDISHNANAATRSTVPPSATFEPPKMKRTTSGTLESMPPMLGSTRANYRGLVGRPGGEPVASGMQPSNVTSAIQSQMISSTAAVPGARNGTSKEVHQLQRKILERNSGLSVGSIGSSYMNDVRAAINNEPAAPSRRHMRHKTSEPLNRIHEDEAVTDVDPDGTASHSQEPRAPSKKKPVKKARKPGYCENCKDKYDDFDEHVVTRKHRKFALTAENWQELDCLLLHLKRPLKEGQA